MIILPLTQLKWTFVQCQHRPDPTMVATLDSTRGPRLNS
jgi:hypothetical protein